MGRRKFGLKDEYGIRQAVASYGGIEAVPLAVESLARVVDEYYAKISIGDVYIIKDVRSVYVGKINKK